jgi:hypothetical protein
MDKRIWIGTAAVFVVIAVVDFILNTAVMESDYQATASLWRPEGEMKIWLFYVVYAFTAFFFTLIFSKGYEGKGLAEGARYGFYVGMLMAVPMAYGSYAAMPITYSLALKWFLGGLVEYVLAGVAVAAVFGTRAAVTRVRAS